jgi:hypothetical protein
MQFPTAVLTVRTLKAEVVVGIELERAEAARRAALA